MALANTVVLNQALNGADASGAPTNQIGFVSLHTATTGTTGTNEATGGGYVRQACTWNAASGGSKTNSTALTFTTTGATPNTHFGAWTLVSAGVFGIGGALTSSVTAVTITVASGAITLSAT
jgi:hypothetical protein